VTWLVVVFLLVHGALHLAVWLPPQPTDAERAAPFAPDESAVLIRARVARPAAHRLAAGMALAAALGYAAAGLAVAVASGPAVGLAVVAAVLGLALKALFFNPWLILGVLLDLAVIGAALLDWPFRLV
jgi:hypothetical protein